jgi:GMP synthase (glutamine-hydrolysing)
MRYLISAAITAIRAAIAARKPVLGICLGAQLLARALGASVSANPVREIGWYDVAPTAAGRDDPLFRHFAAREKIFQWHGDTFAIPDGAVHLATSPDCRNQAFRYGDNVYGLQFHLEVDAPMIHRWLHAPVNVRELEGLRGSIDPERIAADTPLHVAQSQALGNQLFSEFLQLFQGRHRRRALPSR